MSILLLKLILVPLLIGAVSLGGRRWGPGFSGLVVGLPWTSGPVLLFLALERGASFASEAALGILVGVVSMATFCLAYGWTARRFAWPTCTTAGVAAYLGVTFCLLPAGFPAPASFAFVVSALVLAIRAMPAVGARTSQLAETRWDIPLRMACATCVVLVLTGLAQLLGPRLAGLLAPFPVYASIMAAFAHRSAGSWSALETLRGVLRGSFSFALFFLIAGIGMEPLGLAGALLAASLSAVSLHLVLGDLYRGRPAPTSSQVR